MSIFVKSENYYRKRPIEPLPSIHPDLRDQCAMTALHSLVANGGINRPLDIAIIAYEIADAMMEARSIDHSKEKPLRGKFVSLEKE